MAEQKFTIDVNVSELLNDFVPKLVRVYLKNQGGVENLKGQSTTITVDVSGDAYSYTLKDGANLEVTDGLLPGPLVHLSIPLESMSKLAEMKNIDFLMGMQGMLSPAKYKTVSDMQGTTVFQLMHPDGEVSEIKLVFNAAETPTATIKLTMDDAKNITLKGASPIQMYMDGKLTVLGDLAYAINMQSLFS